MSSTLNHESSPVTTEYLASIEAMVTQKRARKPNRSTEEIAAEKKEKEEKKAIKQLAKEQKNTEKVAKKAAKEQKQATKAEEKAAKKAAKEQKAATKAEEKAAKMARKEQKAEEKAAQMARKETRELKKAEKQKEAMKKKIEKFEKKFAPQLLETHRMVLESQTTVQREQAMERNLKHQAEAVAAAKAAKAERKLAKQEQEQQKQTEVTLPNGDMWVNVANCYKLANQRRTSEDTREEFQDKITELGGVETIEKTGIMTTVYENLRPGETMNFDDVYRGSTNIHKDKIQTQFRENESYINDLAAQGSGLTTLGTNTLKRLRRENHALTTQIT